MLKEEMTSAEYLEWLKSQKKGNKFGAVITEYDGYTFQSGVEAERYKDLVLTATSGKITNLQIHAPKIVIVDAFTDRYGTKHSPTYYIPDFSYDESGVLVLEDVKGGEATATALFKLKHKIILSRYPHIDFRIITM
jgi:hypothetical protein